MAENLAILEFLANDDNMSDVGEEASSSSTSSSSDDEYDDIDIVRWLKLLKQRIPSDKIRKKEYVYVTIPGYSEEVFKSHFRMYPHTFEYILSVVGPELQKTKYNSGRKPIPSREQLLITIWIMATPDSDRSVCEKFDVDKATAIRAVHRVTNILYKFASKFIKWPKGQEAKEVAADYERFSAFPNVVGAIDGTHIKFNPSKDDKQSYINRKGYASIQVQAVCTRKLLFTSVFAGHAGSVHDARVFRLSPLTNYLLNPEYFPDDSHLVGDAAYGIHPNIMVPFKDNGHLTVRQKNFNFCLSSARISIERAFGLWKTRWRRIRECLAMVKTAKMPEFIIATCVLHNICILKNDLLLIQMNNVVSTTSRGVLTSEDTRATGSAKRMRIANSLLLRNN